MKKKIILFIFLTLCWTNTAKATDFLNDTALGGYWRFEGNSNDSKNNNNGTDVGIEYGETWGKFGQGAHFSGDTDHITIADSADFDSSQELTIYFWTKNTNAVNYVAGIVTRGYGSSQVVWDMYSTADGKLHVTFFDSDQNNLNPLVSSISLADNAWHQVAITFIRASSINTGTLYIDGALDDSEILGGNALSAVSTADILIGQRAGINNYSGEVDDLAIVRRAYSLAEIQELWANGNGVEIFTSGETEPEPEATTTLPELTTATDSQNLKYLVGIGTMLLVFGMADMARRFWAGYTK